MNKIIWFIIFIPTILFGQEFSFFGLTLGMEKDNIISLVNNHPDLLLDGDILLFQLIPPTPFTMTLKGKKRTIKKIFIDFIETKSYQITIFLDPESFSFYTLSETLCDKYGTPTTRSASKVIWLNKEKNIQLTLESSSIVKITDINKLMEAARLQEQFIEESISESQDYQDRQRLLNEL